MQYKELVAEIVKEMNGNDIQELYKNLYEKEYVVIVLHITNAFWYPEFIYTSDTEEMDKIYNENAQVCVLHTENFLDEFMLYANTEQKKIYDHLVEEAAI